MGPSYNNSFGNSQSPDGVARGLNGTDGNGLGGTGGFGSGDGFGGGMGGSAPAPIVSSGEGDIILTPTPNGNKGGKKWLAVVVVVLFVIAVVTGVAAMLVGNNNGGGQNNVSRESEVHELLDTKGDAVRNLATMVQYMYSGLASLSDFALDTAEETEAAITTMATGIAMMNELKANLDKGEELSGIKNEINLAENYRGLKNALANDLGAYQNFVALTTKLLRVTQNTNTQGEFAGYDATAVNFANEIKEYWASMSRLSSIAPLDGKCTSTDAAVCGDAALEMMTLRSSAKASNQEIVRLYKNNIGDLNYSGEGSLIYYLDGLYAGTEELNAE